MSTTRITDSYVSFQGGSRSELRLSEWSSAVVAQQGAAGGGGDSTPGTGARLQGQPADAVARSVCAKVRIVEPSSSVLEQLAKHRFSAL